MFNIERKGTQRRPLLADLVLRQEVCHRESISTPSSSK